MGWSLGDGQCGTSMWIGWEHGMEREKDRHGMGIASLFTDGQREPAISHPSRLPLLLLRRCCFALLRCRLPIRTGIRDGEHTTK